MAVNRTLPGLEISSIHSSTAVVLTLCSEVPGYGKLIFFGGIFLKTDRILLSCLLPCVSLSRNSHA